VDYNLPERFDLKYVSAENRSERPVMIHRAPLGSLERFCGVLIEHYAGAFPLWLAPEQVRLLPISDKHLAYAERIRDDLRKEKIRVSLDQSSDKIGAKIRLAQLAKVPYMLVLGAREEAAGDVSVRGRQKGDEGVFRAQQFIERVKKEILERQLD
jgi:threonyl-tRNA synthetase